MMLMPGRRGRICKTGQTTRYGGELDDGYYESGLSKTFEVLSDGANLGTSHVDVAHYSGVAGDIAFVAGAKKITDVGAGLAQFKTGDTIICTGPAEANNIAVLTVALGNVAGEIVVNENLTDETPVGAVTLYKREAVSNNAVRDLRTQLLWTRYMETKFGTASNGYITWAMAFLYAAAANAASLGGRTDWRVPNVKEMMDLVNFERTGGVWLDATAWPTAVGNVWVSTTSPVTVGSSYRCPYDDGVPGLLDKTIEGGKGLLVAP